MPNDHFSFKEFTIHQGRSAFKVGTDGVLLGAAAEIAGIKNALDIGSGTGLIAIMIAQRCDAVITAIEPDKGSFSDLVENVTRCRWSGNIKTINTDLQNFHYTEKFDLIISNPPWFRNSLRNLDPVRSAARHNDLLTNTDLLNGVDRYLGENGRFQVILPKTECDQLVAEAVKNKLFCNGMIKIRALPSTGIIRLILTFGRKQFPLAETELTISTGQRHQYTQEYMNLTKDFYLKF